MTDAGKNPYEAGQPQGDAPRRHSSDPSIEHEPHFAYQGFEADVSEQSAGQGLDPLGGPQSEDDAVEHTVWDEPSLNRALAGETPSDAMTYDQWLTKKQQGFSARQSAKVFWTVVLVAGPGSILGTFITQLMGGGVSNGLQGAAGLVAICIVGPLVEEVMKAAAILWIVEKRPYFFISTNQVLLCAIASGLWFAVLENLLYLNVYIPNPEIGLVIWRWTICVALHVGCTLISGIGLSRVWAHTMTTRQRPTLALGANFMIAAVVCHAIYNSLAVIVSAVQSVM